MEILGYCGDGCNACPRYVATQSGDVERLKEVAALWKRAGWRDAIVPAQEMICHGCASVKWCRYNDVRLCAQERGIDNCGKCTDYPCEKIEVVFAQTQAYAKLCKATCSAQDYERFEEAFFSKRKQLDGVHAEYMAGRER